MMNKNNSLLYELLSAIGLVIVFSFVLMASVQGCNAQSRILKYSTFYAAVNGGTSLSDNQVWSITSGQLQEDIIQTPFDYTFSIGIRKIKRFGYENRALTFYNGTENSYSDAANSWVAKVEYLQDGFADIKYFEASQRYRKQIKGGKLSFNVGAVQRLSEPYGFDPLADWVLDNGTLHYTYLALQEGYNITLNGLYYAPDGALVADNQAVWEEVVIPEVINDYVQDQRDALSSIVEYSAVLGFDYYHFTKDFWFHSWGNLMPYHIKSDNIYSYYKFNNGQWVDYSIGLIFGYRFNKSLGTFIEGRYNKYWNRDWHNFSVGLNYVIF
jgi:hypothetical protein